jgi:hypothetical protein
MAAKKRGLVICCILNVKQRSQKIRITKHLALSIIIASSTEKLAKILSLRALIVDPVITSLTGANKTNLQHNTV